MLKLIVKSNKEEFITLTWEGEGSLKHELIAYSDYSTIVNKIKNRQPDFIQFNSGLLQAVIDVFLAEDDIYIKDNGKAYYDKRSSYNEVKTETFELVVGHAYNHIQAKILDEGGYTYQTEKLENNLVKFIVNVK